MKGHEYKWLVARYIVSVYGPRGISLYDELTIGTSIIGKPRRVDLLALDTTGRGLALECKYQDSSGTVDEKIPYALADLDALKMPAILVYAGAGFSDGVLHLLKSSPFGAYCMPDETLKPLVRSRSSDAVHSGTWQLDHAIARTFGFWDILIAGKPPISVADPAGLPLGPRSD